MSLIPWMPLVLASVLSPAAEHHSEAAADSAPASLQRLQEQRLKLHTEAPSGSLPDWVAEDFLIIDHDGARLDRAEFAQRLLRERPFEHLNSDQWLIREYGRAAIVQSRWRGTRDGQTETRRSTDVYVRDRSRWRWVAGQLTRLKPGLSDDLHTKPLQGFGPWHGQDPIGADHDVLHALNESYVDAFRRADVAWYDQHLAADYVVVFGDGSFHDRAAALADFALPVFAEHLKHFPVGAVQIRQFGDLAVIHAENDYERQDGRTGINRYTDIWVRQGGRWQCVSAHITVFRAPG